MKQFLKQSLYRALQPFLFLFRSRWPVVLMYHSIGESRAFFTVKKNVFEKQLQYLQKKKIHTLSLVEYITLFKEKKSVSEPSVLLTFDDGFVDFFEDAVPLLKKYNIRATLFVIPHMCGQEFLTSNGFSFRLLSQMQLHQLQASGVVDFALHDYDDITTVPPEKVFSHLESVFTSYKKIFATDPLAFAYVKGRYSPQATEALEKLGIQFAFTVKPGTNDPHQASVMHLKRNSVDCLTTPAGFAGKLTRLGDFLH